MTDSTSEYEQADWQKHYDENDLRWDLGEPAPPIVRMWQDQWLKPGATLIPGCGRGHEAVFLMEKGFHVTGVDFSSGAVNHLSDVIAKKNLKGRALLENFFELDASHNGKYDLLIEHTFFCAIAPRDRSRYIETALRILSPQGKIAGLFYETGEEGGPPFNTPKTDILKFFSPAFEIEFLEKTPHSAEQRRGKEWAALLVKKSS
ncbi:MAG: methyltransferase domain-containing protein [Candidatus Nitrohelix vancouverensis]|uniref:Methyltransferase domain-containing protein n=1 Tax=Candidatus Nitrohelix vancouverensis TaxID=2705534 RepID=A0A7T0C4G9_9BACT|nr:MAG: methyltransferase domain-containing protein [Candidatus Nitrohelix vancouverensis]